MTTTESITSDYTKVADAGEWNNIQIIGIHQCVVFIQDSGGDAPTTEAGHVYRVLDSFTPDTLADGDVYIKTRQSGLSSLVAIS